MDQNEKLDWRHKLNGFLGIATVLLMIVTAVTTVEFFNRLKEYRYIGQNPELRSEITVSGQAEKFVKPDLAIINMGVKTEAENVNDAMAENVTKMNAVIEALKTEIGLEDENLKTTQFTLSPRYEWLTQKDYIEGERILAGYEVNQMLEVRIRDFDSIGQIIQRATELGANQVGEFSFIVENEDAVRDEIRGEAIIQARQKAEELADQLGVSLSRIIYYYEDVPAVLWARGAGDMAYPESMDSSIVPSIQSGENKVEVSVRITYEIN